MFRLVAAGTIAFLTTACGLLPELASCTTSIEPAVIVEIRDARTGAPLAVNARGVVREGSYVDSLRPAESSSADAASLYSRRAADERPGTYAVEVRHPGYAPWEKTGVRAGRGSCHVETQRVQAALLPAS